MEFILFLNMKNLFSIIVTLFAIIIPTLSNEWYLQNHPTFITEKNINDLLLDQSSIKIVKFFTPWCRYCRYMKKIIDNFHEKIRDEGRKDIKFYEVNCDEQIGICQQFGISTYPHINIFGKNGKILTNIGGYYPQQDTHSILYDIISQIDQQQKRYRISINKPVPHEPQQLDVVQKKQEIPVNKEQKIQKVAEPIKPVQNLQKQNKIEQQNKKINQQQIIEKVPPKTQQKGSYNFEIKKAKQTSTQQTKTSQIKQHTSSFIDKVYGQVGRIIIYLIIGLIGGYYFKDIFSKKDRLNLSNPQQTNQYKYIDQKQSTTELMIK